MMCEGALGAAAAALWPAPAGPGSRCELGVWCPPRLQLCSGQLGQQGRCQVWCSQARGGRA